MIDEKEKQEKRFSIGGIIAGAIFTILGITIIVIQLLSKSKVSVPEAGLGWLTAGVAIFFRSFRPPVGWKKGLVTFFGGLFTGASIIAISVPLRYAGHVGIAQIIVFFIFMIPGILMLRSGFKKLKETEIDSIP